MMPSCITEEAVMKRLHIKYKVLRPQIKYIIQARGQFSENLNWPRAFFVSTKIYEK